MHHLVVAILKDFVAVDVFDIKMGIETEPLLVLSLVGYLDMRGST